MEGELLLLRSPQTIPILTPEMWETVLSHLEPKDLISATNACPQWHHIMMAEQTPALFPLVIPFVIDYLDLKNIKNCRRVSRGARQAVDDTLQENFGKWESRPAASTRISALVERIRVRSYTFDGLRSFRDFIRFMDPDHSGSKLPFSNPFICGSIFLMVWHSPEGELLEILQYFLEMYGENVRSFIFYDGRHLPRCEGGTTSSVELLMWILDFLPNLKSLKVVGDMGLRGGAETLSLSITPLENIEELHLNPLLPSLESLYGLLLMEEWKRTLKSISVGHSFLESPEVADLSFLNNTFNLTRLQVHSVSPIGLKKIVNISWKLEELQLLKCEFSHTDPAAVRLLLQALLQFKTTLSSTKLLLWETNQLDDSMAKDEVMRLECEMMGNLCKLKQLTTGFSCLKLSWFRKFLKRSCQQLQELNLYLYDNDVVPDKTHMITLSKGAFKVIPKLTKIKLFSEKGIKATLFRQV